MVSSPVIGVVTVSDELYRTAASYSPEVEGVDAQDDRLPGRRGAGHEDQVRYLVVDRVDLEPVSTSVCDSHPYERNRSWLWETSSSPLGKL